MSDYRVLERTSMADLLKQIYCNSEEHQRASRIVQDAAKASRKTTPEWLNGITAFHPFLLEVLIFAPDRSQYIVENTGWTVNRHSKWPDKNENTRWTVDIDAQRVLKDFIIDEITTWNNPTFTPFLADREDPLWVLGMWSLSALLIKKTMRYTPQFNGLEHAYWPEPHPNTHLEAVIYDQKIATVTPGKNPARLNNTGLRIVTYDRLEELLEKSKQLPTKMYVWGLEDDHTTQAIQVFHK